MGVDSGHLKPAQVRASSEWSNSKIITTSHLLNYLKLSSFTGWKPTLNTFNEFIEVICLNEHLVRRIILKNNLV